MKDQDWISCNTLLPTEGIEVMTKIDDAQGCRNTRPLTRRGGMWYTDQGKSYVYYTPTHWKAI